MFVHSGPLAWNGILARYVLCVSFFVWMVTMTWLMRRASRVAEATEPDIATAAAGVTSSPGTA